LIRSTSAAWYERFALFRPSQCMDETRVMFTQ
jgi:hypothetical protein